jgi:hypothetical protein
VVRGAGESPHLSGLQRRRLMIFVENQEPTSLIDGGWFASCDDCRWQSGHTRPRARLAGQPTCKLWPWQGHLLTGKTVLRLRSTDTEHGCSVCAARRYSPRESDRRENGNEVVNTERTEPRGSLVAMSATPAAARGYSHSPTNGRAPTWTPHR